MVAYNKKETDKKSPTTGFDVETIEKRIKLFDSYPPPGGWRKYQLVNISMTTLVQAWEHKDNVEVRKTIKIICSK